MITGKLPDYLSEPDPLVVDIRDAIIKRDLARMYGIDPLVTDKLPKQLINIWGLISGKEAERKALEDTEHATNH